VQAQHLAEIPLDRHDLYRPVHEAAEPSRLFRGVALAFAIASPFWAAAAWSLFNYL